MINEMTEDIKGRIEELTEQKKEIERELRDLKELTIKYNDAKLVSDFNGKERIWRVKVYSDIRGSLRSNEWKTVVMANDKEGILAGIGRVMRDLKGLSDKIREA